MTGVYCTACGENMSTTVMRCPRCGKPNDSYRATTYPVPATVGGIGTPVAPVWPVPASPKMAFGDAVQSFFRNYAVFSGRARRGEYWFVQLFLFTVYLGVAVINFFLDEELLALTTAVYVLWVIVILVPSLALTSRRLHDTDTSFGYYFLILIPVVGAILVLVKLATDSTPGPNRFGTTEKYPH
jgi:uncharacterized membrane protein YhaH (DUF805 family)